VKNTIALASCVATLCLAPIAFAWGPDGHEITALIAAQHLSSSKTRTMVFNLLKTDSDTKQLLVGKTANDLDALGAAMARAATWPDRVKRKKLGQGTSNWHFIDLASSENAAVISDRCGSAGDCVTAMIAEFRGDIPSGKPFATQFNSYQPSAELKFLIHFVGDIHQPLHTATDADAGGNCIPTKGFGATELHAEWDSGLVSRITGTGKSKKANNLVAQDIDMEFTPQFATIAGKTDEKEMALESHGVAFSVAYSKILPMLPPPEPRPFKQVSPGSCQGAEDLKATKPIDVTKIYDQTTVETVREQLAKGGYRLAAILDSIAE